MDSDDKLTSGNALCKRVAIGRSEITVVDFAPLHRGYNIAEYIAGFLRTVPAEDLIGVSHIRIHDRVPTSVGNKCAAAGYFSSTQTQSDGAWIEVYLGPTLLYLPDTEKQLKLFGVLWNKLFLRLFGRIFLAASLFHELGHHKNEVLLRVNPETAMEAEEFAKEYENNLLRLTFPYVQQNHELFNRVYRFLYRGRIERALKGLDLKDV